jgi:hypothetical protein
MTNSFKLENLRVSIRDIGVANAQPIVETEFEPASFESNLENQLMLLGLTQFCANAQPLIISPPLDLGGE